MLHLVVVFGCINGKVCLNECSFFGGGEDLYCVSFYLLFILLCFALFFFVVFVLFLVIIIIDDDSNSLEDDRPTISKTKQKPGHDTVFKQMVNSQLANIKNGITQN